MFKVGDKVCDPIRYGNGVVDSIESANRITVVFSSGIVVYYNIDGKYVYTNSIATLYHGHMEEGTAKITFEPKKEPVYEWQWEYAALDTFSGKLAGIYTTGYFTNEAGMLEVYSGRHRKDFIRIERSKRERKDHS